MLMSSLAEKGGSSTSRHGWHRGRKICSKLLLSRWLSYGTGLSAVEPHKSKRRKCLEAIVAALHIIPYTVQTAYEHARLWAYLRGAAKIIGAYDLIVAATSLERGRQLATVNKRRFSGKEIY